MLYQQPDTDKVNLCMDRILYDRQNRVVEEKIPITELIQQSVPMDFLSRTTNKGVHMNNKVDSNLSTTINAGPLR